ncbi:hypothetical protein ACH58_23310 [Achromobacter xylosoxidans]|uniref:lipid II:glycine glycyltransferase FemX n=1 Tax=Alcaligenes xylosoxydans xylosoxydans TaxID=85698 RepID=UPI00064DBADC|nr:GNAT family N-acetyltransferase [Achromobacter xylosoxidans]KMJ88296.1 hypothetical protein ACH58_23310 [Achromobacter xylosoxidans]
MKLVAFREISPETWDAVCDASEQAWLFHRSDWIIIEERHFVGENLSVGFESKGRLVAVLPLYFSDTSKGAAQENLLHSGIHRHAGLACIPGLDPETLTALRSQMRNYLFEQAMSRGCQRIHLSMQSLAPTNLSGRQVREAPYFVSDWGFYAGVAFGPGGLYPAPGMSTAACDQIVMLDVEEKALFSRLAEACRRNVRKAQKFGVTIRSLEQSDSIALYYQMAQVSAQRTGESLAPLAYYEDVWKAFLTSGRCRLLAAEHEGVPIAMLLVLMDKGAASYLGGVSTTKGLELRANDMVHWGLIRTMREEGQHCYRLGPAFPGLPDDWPIVRVSRFKTKFGARSIPLLVGSHFLQPDHYLARGVDLLHLLSGSVSVDGGARAADVSLAIEADPKTNHASLVQRMRRYVTRLLGC